MIRLNYIRVRFEDTSTKDLPEEVQSRIRSDTEEFINIIKKYIRKEATRNENSY